MIKARTILYALFVSLFIYIFTGSFLLLRFYHNQTIIKSKISTDLRNNCLSALSCYFADPFLLQNSNSLFIKPYKEFQESVLIEKKNWGGYEIFITQAESGIYRKKTAFFLGSLKDAHGSVYICDDNKHITVKGNTTLNGDIYVPGAYLKREIFTGKIVPADTIRHSKKNLPQVLTQFEEFAKSLYNIGHRNPFEFSIECGPEIPENISVSFFDSTHIFYSSDKINLSDVNLDGNIIIRSSKSITVDASAHLNNIILSAPEINVLKNFKGSIQLFPDSIIVVQPETSLIYPSFIGMFHNGTSIITISSKAVVAGGIALVSESSKTNEVSALQIEPGAKVYGLVYSNKAIELGGEIYGSLICMYVKTSKKITPEKDVLFDCKVDPTVLKNEFFYPVLFDNSGRDIIFEETKDEITSRNTN